MKQKITITFQGLSVSEVEDIRQLHLDICKSGHIAITKGINMGGRLLTIREQKLKHGEWLPFCKHVGISDTTARRYIRLWENREELKLKFGKMSNLTEAYAATLPEKSPEERFELEDFEKTWPRVYFGFVSMFSLNRRTQVELNILEWLNDRAADRE